MSQDPSHFVQPEVSEARINRLWGSVSEQLERGPSRALRWVVLCTALSGVAAGALLFAKQHAAGPAASAVLAAAKLETGAESLSVTLIDGSSVKLAARTELAVRASQPKAVALALSRGEVTCDVEHQDGRTFTVRAHDVEVRVVGTKFSIKATPEADGARIEVSVLRGMVEVRSARRPGVVARIAAGQNWIQLPEASQLVDAPSAPPPETAAAEPEAVKPSAEPAPSAAVAAGPSARELFEKAGEHRRAGDAAGAAHAYEELLKLHPTDARASLSAFELGRLRMDRLGDQAGAITALERAVAQNVGPSFREDALARLVSAYASQANFAACGRARERYLTSYPAGVHASAVATRCGSR